MSDNQLAGGAQDHPGIPGATRYFCPYDCDWFHDALAITTVAEPAPGHHHTTFDPVFETLKRHMMQIEAVIVEHLAEHSTREMLSYGVEVASVRAMLAHAGQVDKAGRPYREHLFAVRDALAEYGPDAQIAGVFHDVVEDTTVTLKQLREWGYPEHVVRAVDSVTRRIGESYDDLIRRAASDPLGRLVKLADNLHNSSEERLALLPHSDAERLRRKYAKGLEVLEATP